MPACRCLQKYDYQQKMCVKELETLLRCCRSLKAPHGSLHCQGFLHLLQQEGPEKAG